MKLFHATDLHFNQAWFAYITYHQHEVDAICITGDFLEESHDVSIQDQVTWIHAWMHSIKIPLFVCSGNHDLDVNEGTWLSGLECAYSDTSQATIKGVRFGCVPYVAPDFLEYDTCDVMLYHLPPSKTATAEHENTHDDWGDPELHRLLKRRLLTPKVLLCGHLHTPKKRIDTLGTTSIYNAGSNVRLNVPLHHIITI